MTRQTRRWLTEPLWAATVGFAVWLAWIVANLLRMASAGVELSGIPASSGAFLLQVLFGTLWVLVPLAAWVALAMLLNRVFRARELWRRMLMSFLAAVVVCAPFAVFAFVGLARNDGWRGLGVVSLFVPLVAPALAVVLHLFALPVVSLMERRLTQHSSKGGL